MWYKWLRGVINVKEFLREKYFLYSSFSFYKKKIHSIELTGQPTQSHQIRSLTPFKMQCGVQTRKLTMVVQWKKLPVTATHPFTPLTSTLCNLLGLNALKLLNWNFQFAYII